MSYDAGVLLPVNSRLATVPCSRKTRGVDSGQPNDNQHPHATVGTGLCGDYRWLDLSQPVGRAWGRNLPHWRQDGCVYFVTFRLEDSIPADVLTAWQVDRDEWLLAHPHPHDEETAREFHRLFTARIERFLDTCHGACPLRESAARQVVVEVLHGRDGMENGYALDAFVVMPNHVHALVAPTAAYPLSTVVKDWKSVSAHRLNKLTGRKGGLWQHETWDHIVRNPGQMDRFRRYIAENPKWLPQNG